MKRRKDYVAGTVPNELDYYRAIASAYKATAYLDFDEGKFSRVRDGMERYQLARPDDPEGYYLMGEAWRRDNPLGPDFSKAIAAYEQAIAADENYADAWREKGMAYRIQGEQAEARTALERYLALAPGAPDAGIIRAYLEDLQ